MQTSLGGGVGALVLDYPGQTPSAKALADLARAEKANPSKPVGITSDLFGGLVTILGPAPVPHTLDPDNATLGASMGTHLSRVAQFMRQLQDFQSEAPSRMRQALSEFSTRLQTTAAQSPWTTSGYDQLAHNFQRAAATGDLSTVFGHHAEMETTGLGFHASRALTAYSTYGGESSPLGLFGRMLAASPRPPEFHPAPSLAPPPRAAPSIGSASFAKSPLPLSAA